MAGEKIGTLELDELAKRETGGLSDREIEAIAISTREQVDAKDTKKEPPKQEEKKEEKPASEKKTEPTEEELLAKKDEELSEEEKPKKAQIVEKRRKLEEERILNAKDEDLSEEDKPKKAQLLKAQEEAKKKTIEEETQAYAKESNISVDEARQDLESISKIREKYKDDPKQLAKANLYIQRLYSKAENEIKSAKEAKAQEIPEITTDNVIKWMEEGKVTANGKQITKEQVIEAYREANPDITEAMEDDKVLKLAAKDYKAKIEEVIKQQQAELGTKAKEKRETILSTLSDKDKAYLPEIKPLLEKLSDNQIMNEQFSVEPYILYAKGKMLDSAIERMEKEKAEFGKKEFERGKEEAKILGTKSPSGGTPPKNKGEAGLTEAQKKRALQMYDNPNITEEKAYELYKDYLKKTGVEF